MKGARKPIKKLKAENGALVAAAHNRGGSAGFGSETAWKDYALTQCQAIVHYLWLAVWPYPLVFDYGTDTVKLGVEVVACGLALAVLMAGTLVGLWHRRPMSIFGVWFFAILAPSSSVVPVATQTMAEHRMYLPLAAVVAAVIVGGFVLGQSLLNTRPEARRIISGGVVGTLVLLLAFVTIQRNRDYRSDLVLWEDTLAKCPNNPRAHNNLGLDLMNSGRLPEALDHYQQALRIKPDYADAQYNFGVALVQRGRLPEAVGHFEQAVQIQPDHLMAHNNLGVVLQQLGRPQEAMGQFEEMLRIKPDSAEAHGNLGLALLQLGRPQEAIGHFEQIIRLSPEDPEAHNAMGDALEKLGRIQEAIAQYEQALRLNPDLTQARTALARLHAGK
jgi:Tfp pilus assembly protein PilF